MSDDLTAAERVRARLAKSPHASGVDVDVDVLTALLDALAAVEKERDEARLTITAILSRYGKRRPDGSLRLAWYETGDVQEADDEATL